MQVKQGEDNSGQCGKSEISQKLQAQKFPNFTSMFLTYFGTTFLFVGRAENDSKKV